MEYTEFLNSLWHWAQTAGLRILIIIIAALVAQVVISRASRAVLTRALNRHLSASRSDAGKEKRLDTINQVTSKTVGVVIFVAALLMVFIELGINVTPILTGAGILGIAIGFGAQDMVKNIFHGVFVLVEDQYSEGDIVTLAGKTGVVEDFDLRRTVLRDLDGIQHHIPNGEISIASNRTKIWSGINMNIGIAYSTDLEVLKKVIDEAGDKLKEEKEGVIEAPKVAGVDEFADSAIVVKILGKTQPGMQWELAREFRQRLKVAFEKNNIEIPYPHQVEIQKQS